MIAELIEYPGILLEIRKYLSTIKKRKNVIFEYYL